MKTLTKILGVSIATLSALAIVGVASASSADTLQPASTITYNEELVVNHTGRFNSVYIGKQGVGGVTFFNGTIVNSTTGDSDADNPVTFGDNVRVDGAITRGASDQDLPVRVGDDLRIDGAIWGGPEAGNTNDNQSLIVADFIRPQTDNTYSLGSPGYQFKDAYFGGTVSAAGLSGAGIVDSTNIADGTIATIDLANNAVTGAKIAAGTISGSDVSTSADLSVRTLTTSGNIATSGDITTTGSVDGVDVSGQNAVVTTNDPHTGINGNYLVTSSGSTETIPSRIVTGVGRIDCGGGGTQNVTIDLTALGVASFSAWNSYIVLATDDWSTPDEISVGHDTSIGKTASSFRIYQDCGGASAISSVTWMAVGY